MSELKQIDSYFENNLHGKPFHYVPTVSELVADWGTFVPKVLTSETFEGNVHHYFKSVGTRTLIELTRRMLPENLRQALLDATKTSDSLFVAKTSPVNGTINCGTPEHWWLSRIPLNFKGSVKSWFNESVEPFQHEPFRPYLYRESIRTFFPPEFSTNLKMVDKFITDNRHLRPYRVASSMQEAVERWANFVVCEVTTLNDAGGVDDWTFSASWRGDIEEMLTALPHPQKSLLIDACSPFDRVFLEYTEPVGATLFLSEEKEWWFSRLPKGFKERFKGYLTDFRLPEALRQPAPLPPELRNSLNWQELERVFAADSNLSEKLPHDTAERVLTRWIDFVEWETFSKAWKSVDAYLERIKDRDNLEIITPRLSDLERHKLSKIINHYDIEFKKKTKEISSPLIARPSGWWWFRIPEHLDPYTEKEFLQETFAEPKTESLAPTKASLRRSIANIELSHQNLEDLRKIDEFIVANRSLRPFRQAVSVIIMVQEWATFTAREVKSAGFSGAADDYFHSIHWRGEIEGVLSGLPNELQNILTRIISPYDKAFFDATDPIEGSIGGRSRNEWWFSRVPRNIQGNAKAIFAEAIQPFRTNPPIYQLPKNWINPKLLAEIEQNLAMTSRQKDQRSVEHYLASWRETTLFHSFNDDFGGVDSYIARVRDRDVIQSIIETLPRQSATKLQQVVSELDDQFYRSTKAVPGKLIDDNNHRWWFRIPKGFDQYTEAEFKEALKPSVIGWVRFYFSRFWSLFKTSNRDSNK